MNTDRPKRRHLAARVNPVSAGVAIAVGSAMTLPAAPALAQGNNFFEEIVVTATRRESAAQDVPYNIAAFTGDTLQKQRITNLGEFARWVPGLNLTDQGARNSSLLTVRGLNASQLGAPETTLGNSSGDTVATYLGEVPLYVDLKPYDVDRIEVLIGPQGTLYGAGTLAGAVRYIQKKPDPNAFTLDVHGGVSNKSHSGDTGYEGDIIVNVPLIGDKLAFRGLIGYIEEAGFVDYNFLVKEPGISNPEDPADLTSREDADDEETLSIRAALLWDVADDAELTYTYYYQNQDVGGRTINHVDSFGTDKYESGHRYVEPNERENQLHSLVLDWDIGDLNSVTAIGYSQFDEEGQRDQTDLLLNFEYGYENFPAFSAFTREDGDTSDTLTLESRLVSNFDSPVNFIVGAFYKDEETDRDVSREFAPCFATWADDPTATCIPGPGGTDFALFPNGDLEFIQIDGEKNEELAFFGEVGWAVSDRWTLTGGLRWFDYDVDASTAATVPFFDPGLGDLSDPTAPRGGLEPPDTGNTSDNDVIFKLNASVNLDGLVPNMDTGTAYFTFSQGYRIGGFNFAPACMMPLPPGQNVCALPNEREYENDTTDNYELGLKSTWFDDRLTVNASLFYIEWQDAQVETITVNGALPITANAAETENYGTELAIRGQLTDSLAVYATYAYNHSELSKDSLGIVGTRTGSINAFDGDKLPGTPEHSGGLFVNYSRDFLAGTTLDVDYGFSSISEVRTKIGARGSGEILGGFTVHNLSATVQDDVWSATLYVDNLTDKFARTGVRADSDFIDTVGLFELRRYYHNIIQPRKLGLEFRYRFDFE